MCGEPVLFCRLLAHFGRPVTASGPDPRCMSEQVLVTLFLAAEGDWLYFHSHLRVRQCLGVLQLVAVTQGSMPQCGRKSQRCCSTVNAHA